MRRAVMPFAAGLAVGGLVVGLVATREPVWGQDSKSAKAKSPPAVKAAMPEPPARVDPAKPIDVTEPQYAELQRVLDKRVDLDFKDTPLADVLQFLGQHLDANLIPNHPGLQAAMVEFNVPITIAVRNVSARDALRMILDPLDLACTIRNGALSITHRAEQRKLTRLYPVADLVVVKQASVHTDVSERLTTTVMKAVWPDLWEPNGGDATLTIFPVGMMVVSAPQETHEQIEGLLSAMRRARGQANDLLRASGLPIVEELLAQRNFLATIAPTPYPPPVAFGGSAAPDQNPAAEAKRVADTALQLARKFEADMKSGKGGSGRPNGR